jgi:hypothetical protein
LYDSKCKDDDEMKKTAWVFYRLIFELLLLLSSLLLFW